MMESAASYAGIKASYDTSATRANGASRTKAATDVSKIAIAITFSFSYQAEHQPVLGRFSDWNLSALMYFAAHRSNMRLDSRRPSPRVAKIT